VVSPEQDSIVATYMRALADISGRTAELRIRARVAQDLLEAARAYQLVTQEAVERLGVMSASTVTFRMEVLREYASARKALVSQETEVAESTIQLASLDEFIKQLRRRLDEVESHFGHGKVFAPMSGIVSTALADVGQSLTAGTPIAEILDPTDIFVDWYIPNERLIDPTIGNEVFVLFGNRRIPGKIAQILPVSGVYAGTQQLQLLARDRPATQIARIRFDPDATPPPLNSTVEVQCTTSACSAASPTGSSISRGLSEHDAADIARSARKCRLKRINRCARPAAPKGCRFFRCCIT